MQQRKMFSYGNPVGVVKPTNGVILVYGVPTVIVTMFISFVISLLIAIYGTIRVTGIIPIIPAFIITNRVSGIIFIADIFILYPARLITVIPTVII